MTTLTLMKARIARELRRSNISTQIAEAIGSAIQAYQAERFHFNERRDVTFPTVAAQEFYDSSDLAALGDLLKIDYVKLIVGDQNFTLLPDLPSEIESAATNSTAVGMPGWYLWYGLQMRLYPIPAEVFTVRVAGMFRYAAPLTDGETGNFWMTDAEMLIRSRAKYELALQVLYDDRLANTMGASVMEALSQLKRLTNKLTTGYNGRVIPMSM